MCGPTSTTGPLGPWDGARGARVSVSTLTSRLNYRHSVQRVVEFEVQRERERERERERASERASERARERERGVRLPKVPSRKLSSKLQPTERVDVFGCTPLSFGCSVASFELGLEVRKWVEDFNFGFRV